MYNLLNSIVKNNFDLLLIFEDKKIDSNLENILNINNIFVRFVKFFTDENHVTTGKYDKSGWRKIFREFKPNFKLNTTKRFKFNDL